MLILNQISFANFHRRFRNLLKALESRPLSQGTYWWKNLKLDISAGPRTVPVLWFSFLNKVPIFLYRYAGTNPLCILFKCKLTIPFAVNSGAWGGTCVFIYENMRILVYRNFSFRLSVPFRSISHTNGISYTRELFSPSTSAIRFFDHGWFFLWKVRFMNCGVFRFGT